MSRTAVVAALLATVAVGLARPLRAATVTYPTLCRRSVEILRWSPTKGPAARYVADAFRARTTTAVWIGLGSTATAFWSVEGGDANDACDDCQVLALVETRFDGTRHVHHVLGPKDPSEPTAQHARVLATLWALAAKKVWSPAALDASFAATPAPAKVDVAPPYLVTVASKGHPQAVYDLRATTSMCWCQYEFRSWVVP